MTTDTFVNSNLRIQTETSILDIDKTIWNQLIGTSGIQDYDGLKFIEQTFGNNELKENNWNFWYIIIYDEIDHPILATVLSSSLWKDDMLANLNASKHIEEKRQNDPYYMTSKVLSLGCLFTEGNHLYLDENHTQMKDALNKLMQLMERLEKKSDSKMIGLRDFNDNQNYHNYFLGQGFVRIQMPNSCKIELKSNETIEDYISNLSTRSKKHFRKDIEAYEHLLQISVHQNLDDTQITQVHQLYENVRKNNLGLNTFSYPLKLFKNMSDHPDWEFIIIRIPDQPKRIIGVMFCYKNNNQTYVPSLVGMDYDYLDSYQTYRQLLYQTIKRAIEINFKHIDLGMTASFEKRKLGATVEEKFAYIQTSDNYTLELLGLLENK